jgi:RNA polymerase sigma factor (sigma-70 family)
MATGQLQGVVSYLRRAVSPRDGAGASDAQLLQRYATQQDEPAFELLVWRHAQLVLGTARRVVADEQTAEDCFQAVFLALAQAAKGVGRSGSVGGWLYKVAYRVARKARASAAKRAAREQGLDGRERCLAQPGPAESAAWREVGAILDEEVSRLPEQYREAFVLRCLVGKSSAEAARELGCPLGTVESRLARARERLRGALACRGISAPGSLLAGGLCAQVAVGAVAPAPLVSSTVGSATLFVAGKTVTEVASAEVAALTHGALKGLIMTKTKMAAMLLVAVATLAAGGSTFLAVAGREGPMATAAAPGQKPVAPKVAPKEARPKPGPKAADAQFVRRAYLDVLGTLPSADEVRNFVADKDPNKRKKLAERLLAQKRRLERALRLERLLKENSGRKELTREDQRLVEKLLDFIDKEETATQERQRLLDQASEPGVRKGGRTGAPREKQ